MKKSLSLLVIALLLGGSVSVFAAISDIFSSINYSANFGLLTGSSSWSEQTAATTDSDSNKLGFHVNGHASYDINESFAANLGLGYKALNSEQVNEAADNTIHALNYVYVPATISYTLPYEWSNLTFNVSAGGYGSYLINATTKVGDNEAIDVDEDVISSADIGATFGASVTFASPITQLQSITTSVGYDYGFRDISQDVSNQNISFSLAAQF